MVKKIKKEIKNFKWKKIAKKIVCQFGRAVQGGSFRCYSVTGRGFESLNWQNRFFEEFINEFTYAYEDIWFVFPPSLV